MWLIGFIHFIFHLVEAFTCNETSSLIYSKSLSDCPTAARFPPRYLSGSIHYFRVHPSDWRDRLRKLRWSGCNAVQTYIEWSSHEPEPGIFEFSGAFDVERFISIANEEDLMVILRPGPYICSERDMGGLPYWLLRLHPDVRLRTSDPRFMKYVTRWFDQLLPRLWPFMVERGGPVIMVQVENEYSNWNPSDLYYLTSLAHLFRRGLGNETFLFSTDNGKISYLQRSKIPGVYATVDFGIDASVEKEFGAQRIFEPNGPLINSEFYPGWMDHWGFPHSTVPVKKFSDTLDHMLREGASVNIYLFHGGTSFGFGAGSNFDDGSFKTCPTSYDYDAPLNEAGDPTDKYFAVRAVAKRYTTVPSGPPPTVTPKYSYGYVKMEPNERLLDLLPRLNFTKAIEPLSFEALGVQGGIVAYQTTIWKSMTDPAILRMEAHDVAYAFLNHRYVGMTSRARNINEIAIYGRPNQTLTIFVQSQGRISVGPYLKDFKGLLSLPTLNGHHLMEWKMIPIPMQGLMNTVTDHRIVPSDAKEDGTMIYHSGVFHVPEDELHPQNTFLRFDDWTKGYVWINGYLLGLYWPVMGPQITLYIPHGLLRQGSNDVFLLELENSPCFQKTHCFLKLQDTNEIDGPTPPIAMQN